MNSLTISTRYIAGVMLAAALLVGGFAVMAMSAHADVNSGSPTVSGAVATPTDTGATITWTSDQAGTSQVLYGLTTAYDASSTLDSTDVTSHTAFLGGLLPNTLYHFEVVTASSTSGLTGTSSDMTFMTASSTATTTPPVASTTAPLISSVLATPTADGAVITWTTDQNADSQVMYGPTTAYGNTTVLDPTQTMSHTVTITGLGASTFEHFAVMSSANGMAASSTDFTFTTMAASTTGTGTTGSTTNDMITDLQNQITALTARVATLEAEVAALMAGGGNTGGTGSTTPPTNTSSGTLDQANMTVSAGGTINFGGRGFPHEENITITLNGTTVATVHADGGGNFSSGSIMAPTTPGTYHYVLTGSTGDVSNATVTVQ